MSREADSRETSEETSAPTLSIGSLPTAVWERLSRLIEEFESEWNRERVPRLETFLEAAGELRPLLLKDLLHVDIEYRLRKGHKVRIADYLAQLPELRADSAASLVAELETKLQSFQNRQARTKLHGTSPSGDAPSQPTARAGVEGFNGPDKYEPIAKIGAGGMGVVWRVRHRMLRTDRAVKLIHPDHVLSPESWDRMRQEAEAMARIEGNSHGVLVHDLADKPVPYIEMEYVPGQSLDKLLKPGAPMPLEWTARILSQLCDVLQRVHDKGIVHRDLKLSNIMLLDGRAPGDEFLKLLDFGVAKLLADDLIPTLTQANQPLGTWAYMSPEQAVNAAAVDFRSDIYSLGAILYVLLTGVRYLKSRQVTAMVGELLNTPAPRFQERNPNVSIPRPIEDLVLRCLEKEPQRRPASARALAEEFHRLVFPPPPPPTNTLNDKYEYLEKIGEGAMGVVWRVRHIQLNSVRAVKLIHPNHSLAAESWSRMVKEARSMDRLKDNLHVVQVHDIAEKPVPYIEMDFVPGKSLEKLLKPGVPMPLEWTSRILSQLCDVLHQAHDLGIVHRDLKPSNIMLLDGRAEGDEFLKLLDFGIAKLHEDDELLTATQRDSTLGTWAYMSPEQAENAATVDFRSDIYSLGAILFELLTGVRHIKSRQVMGIAQELLHTPAPRFQERNPDVSIPRPIEDLVLRCLEKKPLDRPASAAVLAEEFRRLVLPPPPPSLPTPPPRRPNHRLAVVAATVGIGCGGFAAFYLPSRPPVPPPIVAELVGSKDVPEGGSREVLVSISPHGSASEILWDTAVDPKETAYIQPDPAYQGRTRHFKINFSLNHVGETPAGHCTLRIRALDPRSKKPIAQVVPDELKFDVKSLPDIALPNGWSARLGAERDSFQDRAYPKKIERLFPDTRAVVALLCMPPGNASAHDRPFYIMEDKVWVGLYKRFASEKGENEAGYPRDWGRDGSDQDNKEWDPLYPVYNITGEQATAFARWLGGVHGKLPTTAQWDLAAGKDNGGGRKSPCPDGAEKDKTVAINRNEKEPMRIDEETLDVSPIGCRHMSGNGFEWTRLPEPKPVGSTVQLRAMDFQDAVPFRFDTIEERNPQLSFTVNNSYTGFRVVLELGH